MPTTFGGEPNNHTPKLIGGAV
ncbi:hypothetical protein [Staphylococcus aureus]